MRSIGAFALVLLCTLACDSGTERPAASKAEMPGSAAAQPDAAWDSVTIVREDRSCDSSQQLDPVQYGTDPDHRAERASIQANASHVRRDSLSLLLRLHGGRVLELRDCLAAGDDTRTLTFIGRGPRDRGYVVRAIYYEASGVLWVNDSTGEKTFLVGEPTYAPDSQHFAVANADLEAGYTENLFAIWRVQGTAIEEVLRAPGGSAWGAAKPTWKETTEVHFERLVLDANARPTPIAPGIARRIDGQWAVTNPMPPG
jgi:hypothetical protein